MQQALFFSFLKKLDLKNKKGHQNYFIIVPIKITLLIFLVFSNMD